MLVQVHTDNHIQGDARLAQFVQTQLEGSLERFGDQVIRVEAYLADENSTEKKGDNDKRCTIEARLAGLQPIAVHHRGSTLEQAIDGAVEKLENTLDHTIDRVGHKKGRISFGGDQAI
ncbi:MAG: HPF/RaiA family ribosome-associated protein [Gemmataceae bacterium]